MPIIDILLLLGIGLVFLGLVVIVILYFQYWWVVFTTSDWFLGIKKKEKEHGN